MTTDGMPEDAPVRDGRGGRVSAEVKIGLVLFAALLVAGLTWAKWWPYSHRLGDLLGGHAYPGGSVPDTAGPSGADGTSGLAAFWQDGWRFALDYGAAVWIALVAALFVAAGVETLVPRRLLVRAMNRSGHARGPIVSGMLSMPCMMCTCCSAPITTSLRRSGVSVPSALAYWLGNPLLNPAVLAFLLIVLPWQYMTTRLVIGAALVFALPMLIARFLPGAGSSPGVGEWPGDGPGEGTGGPRVPGEAQNPGGLRSAPVRYLRALGRLTAILVPEYFVVVFLVGALRGRLLPLGDSAAGWGAAAVLIAALAGTLLVIPTGGEIPVITGLLAAGSGAGVTGALLIALPALSLPSMVMAGRALSWRVTGAAAAAVLAGALVAAAMLPALGV